MLNLTEIQILMQIITDWQDRQPMKIFAMGKGGELQSALAKLQHMANVPAAAEDDNLTEPPPPEA